MRKKNEAEKVVYDDDLLNKHDLSFDFLSCAALRLALVFPLFSDILFFSTGCLRSAYS